MRQGWTHGETVRVRRVPTVIVVSLALAACGGGGEVTSETTASTTAVAPIATEPTIATTEASVVDPATTTSDAPATTNPVVLSEEAAAAQAVVDRLIVAWNDGDEQAVRELFSPDFSYNDASGIDRVDGATDKFVGYVDDFELVRASEAVENETGTLTWVIEFWSDASTRYPTELLDLDITFHEGTISHIDEHWHREG